MWVVSWSIASSCRVTALDEAIAEENGDISGRGPKQADILIDLAQSAELFHAPDGTGFADLKNTGSPQAFAVWGTGLYASDIATWAGYR